MGRTPRLLLVLSVLCACGASQSQAADPIAKIKSAQTTLGATGYRPLGDPKMGHLDAANPVRLPIELKEGCYLVEAFGDSSLASIEVSVHDAIDAPLGMTSEVPVGVGVKFCAAEKGNYTIVVSAKEGTGNYHLLAFENAPNGISAQNSTCDNNSIECQNDLDNASHMESESDCTAAEHVDLPLSKDDRIRSRNSNVQLYGCLAGYGSGRYYSFTLEKRARLVADVDAKFDATLALVQAEGQNACAQNVALDCSDDAFGSIYKSHIEETLPPGDYGFVVAINETGGPNDNKASSKDVLDYSLTAHTEPAPPVAQYCKKALAVGANSVFYHRPAFTKVGFPLTQASQKPWYTLYSIDVSEPSRVRIKANGSGSDRVVFLGDQCGDGDGEFEEKAGSDSLLTAEMSVGKQYFLIGNEGTESQVNVETVPVGGVATAGDSCASALPMTGVAGDTSNDGSQSVDFFYSRAGVKVGCATQSDPKAPTAVYKINLKSKSLVEFGENNDLQVAIQKQCGDPKSELLCQSMASDTVSKVLDPGVYYAVVQPRAAEPQSKWTTLSWKTNIVDLSDLEKTCSQAKVLESDKPARDELAKSNNRFGSKCVRSVGTYNAEKLYRFTLRETSNVELRLDTGSDMVLSLRKACDSLQTTEVSCNYYGYLRTWRLAPGTYYVVASSYHDQPFELRLTATPVK